MTFVLLLSLIWSSFGSTGGCLWSAGVKWCNYCWQKVKLQRKAESWQLISQRWHKTAANENYSGWFVFPCSTTHTHTFTHTHIHAHTREENISEHKGQSRAEISGGRQEVDIKQWNISPSSSQRSRSSEKSDLHKSPEWSRFSLLTPLCQNSESSPRHWRRSSPSVLFTTI